MAQLLQWGGAGGPGSFTLCFLEPFPAAGGCQRLSRDSHRFPL